MAADLVGRAISFRGCKTAQGDCTTARFAVVSPQGVAVTVEVRTTAQIEHILARELGKASLDAPDREAILSLAGRQLIEGCLEKEGAVGPLLFLDSRLFRVPGAERRLLQECGLLPGRGRSA